MTPPPTDSPLPPDSSIEVIEAGPRLVLRVPAGFPSLPDGTRIRLVRADFQPSPHLDVQIEAEYSFAQAAFSLAALALVGGGVWLWFVYLTIVNLAEGELDMIIFAGSASAFVALFVFVIAAGLIEPTTRTALSADEDGLTVERVWFSRVQAADLRFAAGTPAVERARVVDPRPGGDGSGREPLYWVRGGARFALTTPLPAPERTWLILSLNRVWAAAGRADRCPVAPELAAAGDGAGRSPLRAADPGEDDDDD